MKAYLMPDGNLVRITITRDQFGTEWVIGTPEAIDQIMLSAGAVRVDEAEETAS